MMMNKNMSEKDMAKHMKMHGWKMLVLGVLVMLNAAYAFMQWSSFIGLLLVLVGLKKLLMPCCKKK
jgi:uncharacterized membrane protein HdeD (DUF308 family)